MFAPHARSLAFMFFFPFLLEWNLYALDQPARNDQRETLDLQSMERSLWTVIQAHRYTQTHTGRLHFPLSAQICALHKPTRVSHPYDALTRTQQRIWGLFWHEVIDMQRDSRERQANMNSEGQTDKHTAQSLRFRAQQNPANNSEIKGSGPSSFMLCMVINNQ